VRKGLEEEDRSMTDDPFGDLDADLAKHHGEQEKKRERQPGVRDSQVPMWLSEEDIKKECENDAHIKRCLVLFEAFLARGVDPNQAARTAGMVASSVAEGTGRGVEAREAEKRRQAKPKE
jgi:hypothetical protein